MGKSIKLKDVASIAGVSEATVSYVVNGKAEKMKITPATQARVLAAVRQTGYTPNRQARDMALGNRTSTGSSVDLTTALASAGYRLIPVTNMDDLKRMSAEGLVGVVYSAEQPAVGSWQSAETEGNVGGALRAAISQKEDKESAAAPVIVAPQEPVAAGDCASHIEEGEARDPVSEIRKTEGNVGGALRAATGSTTCLDGTIAATALRQSSGQERASHIEEAPTAEQVPVAEMVFDVPAAKDNSLPSQYQVNKTPIPLEGESRIVGMSRVDEEIPEVPTPSSSSGQPRSNVDGQGSNVDGRGSMVTPSEMEGEARPSRVNEPAIPVSLPVIEPLPALTPVAEVETPALSLASLEAGSREVRPPEERETPVAEAVTPPPESATTLTQDGSSRQSGISATGGQASSPEESVVSGLMSEVLAPPAAAEPSGDINEKSNT